MDCWYRVTLLAENSGREESQNVQKHATVKMFFYTAPHTVSLPAHSISASCKYSRQVQLRSCCYILCLYNSWGSIQQQCGLTSISFLCSITTCCWLIFIFWNSSKSNSKLMLLPFVSNRVFWGKKGSVLLQYKPLQMDRTQVMSAWFHK